MRFAKILLATTNKGKIVEQRRVLQGIPLEIEIVTLAELSRSGALPAADLEPPEEPGPTFRDNAIVKALAYHERTGLATVGEDSGIVVDALGGEPGVHSARWLGERTSYVIKNRTLIERLQGVEEDRRSARFVSAVTLVDAGRVVFEAEETCEGRIAHEPRGFGGFGYDPVFYFPPLGKTLAEASNEEKDAVSHRGKSTAALREFLIENASENTKSSKAIEPC